MAANNILIILGMHRSGTSVITQWLQNCGLHVGDSLVEADVGNKDGYFEDWDFVRIHLDALKYCGFPDSGLISEPIELTNIYHSEKIDWNVAFKNSLYKQWGWKDPRTCLFLSQYRNIVPHAKYLIIL